MATRKAKPSRERKPALERYHAYLMGGRVLHIDAGSKEQAERLAIVWHQHTDAVELIELSAERVRCGKEPRVVRVIRPGRNPDQERMPMTTHKKPRQRLLLGGVYRNSCGNQVWIEFLDRDSNVVGYEHLVYGTRKRTEPVTVAKIRRILSRGNYSLARVARNW